LGIKKISQFLRRVGITLSGNRGRWG